MRGPTPPTNLPNCHAPLLGYHPDRACGTIPAMSVWATALSFATKEHRSIDAGEIEEALGRGEYVWLDLAPDDLRQMKALAERLKIHEDILEDAFMDDEAATQHARYSTCLHMVMSGCYLRGDDFGLQRLDAVVGESFLMTIHREPIGFVDKVKREFLEDFIHHAQTPSFLIYELWDHLLDSYMAVQEQFEQRVEAIQTRLIGDVDETLFAEIGEVGSDLVHFRKVLLPARAVLTDLSIRKNRFVSEATQPFLGNMIGTVERVLQDLVADREILRDSLNLHVSAVSHRTNNAMRRLTGVSVIFLPLTFLVGVYGMNFEFQPELHWQIGYALFWGVAAAITVVLLLLLHRKNLL